MGLIIQQCLRTTGNDVTVRSHLRHDHHGNGARRGEERKRTAASGQRGSPGSGQGPHTGSTSDVGMGRTDRRSPEAGGSGAANAATLTGYEVRSCEVLRGRSDVPIRTSSHHSGGRQVRRTTPSRERAATVASSTQVWQSTTDPTVSRTPMVAGHTTRQVGSDEGMLRAVSVWLGKRGITLRCPKWLSMVRSEAV